MTQRQRGSALIETVFLSLLLIVPLIWTLGVLADLHRSALALTAAVREGGAEAARAADAASAARALDAAVAEALGNHGLDPSLARVEWSGSPGARGSVVEVSIRYPVSVVQAPLLGNLGGPSIWVDARHIVQVDPFRSRDANDP